MKPSVLIAEPSSFSVQAVEILRASCDVVLEPVVPGELRSKLASHDAVWIRLGHKIGAGTLPAKPRCRVIATATTGLDHLDLEACAHSGIQVVSLRGETEFLREVRATAELTVGLALALLRRIPAAALSVQAGRWDRDSFRGRELYGKTVGIVGMGRLGRLAARIFQGFGMRVWGFDPRPDFPHKEAERAGSLGELLAAADVVSLHVSYGPETHHLLGRRELSTMKPGAVLINTSRGGVVDGEALLEALQSRHLGGAALDVLEGEPAIDAAHPLVAYSRVHPELLIVPHIGGNTTESFEKTEVFLAGRLVEALLAPAGAVAGSEA